MELETIDFDLRELVEDVTELVAESAHRKGLEVLCRFAATRAGARKGRPGPAAPGARETWYRNAVKFTESGEVLVQVDRSEAAVPTRGLVRRSAQRGGGEARTGAPKAGPIPSASN